LAQRNDPILLVGIMPRSGTNFAYNLLRPHPAIDCVTDADMPEDFLLFHSNLLIRYADLVAAWWVQHWRPGRGERETRDRRRATADAIAAALGSGLVAVLERPETAGRRVATKTPVVRNMDNVFRLFPEAHLIVLVRDGRDQVQSAMRSYGWSFDFAAHRWAEAARTISSFEDAHRGDDPRRYVVVRYEDLLDAPEATLRELFAFLGVGVEGYDFTVHERLPVFGSSSHLAADEGLASGYKRVERDADFNPRRRWESWTPEQLGRFNAIAGAEMVRLGYELEGPVPEPSALQRVRDVPWHVRTAGMRALDGVERLAAGVQLYRRRALEFRIDQ
jgi:hypothetical protein